MSIIVLLHRLATSSSMMMMMSLFALLLLLFCLLFRSYLLCFLYTSAKCCKMLILQFYSTHELLSSPLINIILKVKTSSYYFFSIISIDVAIHTSSAIYKCVKLLIIIDYFSFTIVLNSFFC